MIAIKAPEEQLCLVKTGTANPNGAVEEPGFNLGLVQVLTMAFDWTLAQSV